MSTDLTSLFECVLLAERLHRILDRLTDEERLAVFQAVEKGYCRHCGRPMKADLRCHCTNDE